MTPLESRTLSIDLDQTLCRGDVSDYASATPEPGAAEALRHLRGQGWVVVIYTARHFNHWKTTVEWLAHHGFSYDQIVFGKPPARYYIDDRAVSYRGNWRELCDELGSPR
jgi:hypothetical protein